MPVNKRRIDLERLPNHRLQSENRGGLRRIRIVGLNRNRLHLLAGAAADAKRSRDLPFFAGSDLLLLRLGGGASA